MLFNYMKTTALHLLGFPRVTMVCPSQLGRMKGCFAPSRSMPLIYSSTVGYYSGGQTIITQEPEEGQAPLWLLATFETFLSQATKVTYEVTGLLMNGASILLFSLETVKLKRHSAGMTCPARAAACARSLVKPPLHLRGRWTCVHREPLISTEPELVFFHLS